MRAFDHAEGGIFRDRYAITIKDAAGNVVLEANGLSTNSITNGPSASMGVKGTGNGNGPKNPKDPAVDASPPGSDPRDTACREDPTINTPDLQWGKELGCISGGNFQIHPPNKGHPY